ncbi:LTA synthase family protein [Ruminococcus sp.]|uniref:LTA synthase family protein n=1 Tax=Ruminococcus sp. TaxID=41978 RepID=UPI0025D65289|nr:LTA synthase family protein [Ruminococcus sp.]
MKNKSFKALYNIIVISITIIISVFIAFLLIVSSIQTYVILLHSLTVILSITALFIIPKPFFRSKNWFYKLVFSGIYIIAMCSATDQYIQSCIANYSYDLSKWFLQWIIPVLIYYSFYLADKLFTNQYISNKRLGMIWKSWTIYYSPLHKQNKSKLQTKVSIYDIVDLIIFFIATCCIAVTIYLKLQFPNTELSVIIFTLKFIQGGITKEIAIIITIFAIVILVANIIFLADKKYKNNLEIFELKSPDKSESFIMEQSKLENGILKRVPLIIFLVCSAVLLIRQVGLKDYIIQQTNSSNIYEEYYVKPDMKLLTFPEKKKNLIYISAESIENTYTSFDNGGIQSTDYIPNLAKLALNNINFSNNQQIGGQSVFYSSINYTMGSCVAQTSGISFLSNFKNIINKDNPTKSILPSAIKLEKLLSEADYNQLYIKSERAEFAGSNIYFGIEKNSRLFDYETALNEGYLPSGYVKHFGFEDAKLFDISKKLISELSKEDKPFAVTLYTLDTHMPEGGFRCELCDQNITDNRIAAIKCSDRQIADFVNWIQAQPFADDTVIIIYGDHLSPVEVRSLFKNKPSDYIRTTYNCIINAQKKPVNEKNRIFTSMDMYPTTLSALGVKINGDRLGLGTDLFSDRPTLCEELGEDIFTHQIQLNSKFFQHEFWKET